MVDARGVRDDGLRLVVGVALVGAGARSHEKRRGGQGRAGQGRELRVRYTDGAVVVVMMVMEELAAARSAESAVVVVVLAAVPVHGSSSRPLVLLPSCTPFHSHAIVREAAHSPEARAGPLADVPAPAELPGRRRAGPDPALT